MLFSLTSFDYQTLNTFRRKYGSDESSSSCVEMADLGRTNSRRSNSLRNRLLSYHL